MAVQERAIKTIFLAAMEKATTAERAACLDASCGGDAELRRQVEALLAAHDRSDQLLDQSAAQHLADEATSLEFLEPPTKPDALGRLGHYEVLEVVGRGGMGVVLRAFDEKLRRVVAIKALSPILARHSGARQRFVREARAAAAISHDHVIAVYAVEESGPVPYLVMQFVSGRTLKDKLELAGPLPLKETLRIGLQLAEGLSAAHRQGLIHRDIKPANIMLENGVERVKITDFGLARAADDSSLTHSGVVAGTPAYMSPEQANGLPVDCKSDLFSLGSVLYTLCAGHPPFRADTSMAILKRVCHETPRSLRQINPDVPPWLEALIFRLMAKEPGQRFASAAEVATLLSGRLAELQSGSASTDATSQALHSESSRSKRRRALLAGSVAALAVVAAGFGGWWIPRWLGSRGEQPPAAPVAPVVAHDDHPGETPAGAAPVAPVVANDDHPGETSAGAAPPAVLQGQQPAQAPVGPVELQPAWTLTGHEAGVLSVAISPDGSTMASGGKDRTILLWDVISWRVRGKLTGHVSDVSGLAFSPDGKRLASVSTDPDSCAIRLWDPVAAESAGTLGGATSGILAVAWSPDGALLMCGGWKKEIHIWVAATGEERLIITGAAAKYIRSVAFSPKGDRIATGGSGHAHLWDAKTGYEIHGDFPDAFNPSFLPSGDAVVGWMYEIGGIAICDAATGREKVSWKAHPHLIEGLTVSPDGRYLVSLGREGVARVWCTADRSETATLIGHKGAVYTAAFTPDGSHLATTGVDDSTVRIWDLPPICRVRK
jgi:serine/threonine protein kinase